MTNTTTLNNEKLNSLVLPVFIEIITFCFNAGLEVKLNENSEQ